VATGRKDFGKGGLGAMTFSEKKSCSVGSPWVYIFDCRNAKK